MEQGGPAERSAADRASETFFLTLVSEKTFSVIKNVSPFIRKRLRIGPGRQPGASLRLDPGQVAPRSVVISLTLRNSGPFDFPADQSLGID